MHTAYSAALAWFRWTMSSSCTLTETSPHTTPPSCPRRAPSSTAPRASFGSMFASTHDDSVRAPVSACTAEMCRADSRCNGRTPCSSSHRRNHGWIKRCARKPALASWAKHAKFSHKERAPAMQLAQHRGQAGPGPNDGARSFLHPASERSRGDADVARPPRALTFHAAFTSSKVSRSRAVAGSGA